MFESPGFWQLVSAVLVAGITGYFTWCSVASKGEADGQKWILDGFIGLLNEFKAEREGLKTRIDDLEAMNRWQERRIVQLERCLRATGVDVPETDGVNA